MESRSFEPNGKIYSLVSHTTLTHFDKNENAYYLPQELSKTIFNLVKQLTKKVKDPKCIRGIAITGMAEAGVPINKEGNWLYPAITWFDKRTQPQMNWWKKNCNLNELYKITGLDLSYIYSINKIMWLKENEPDIFKKIFKWLCIPDYIAFKLTGEMKMDYSIASRTMAFDISKKCGQANFAIKQALIVIFSRYSTKWHTNRQSYILCF